MTDYLREAFQKLQVLNEADFNISDTDDDSVVDELSSFVADDVDVPEEEIIDVEADDENDLQDNYIGKVILECSCCHTRIYKNEEDVYLDEETGLSNADEECPVCNTMSGYMVIGKIEPFDSGRDLETEAEMAFDAEEEGAPVEDLPFEGDDEFDAAFDEVGEEELQDDDFGESLEEEMLEHGNENLGASDELATDDTLSLEDDQTELVHAADENVPSLTEEKHEDDCEESCNEAKVCEKCGKEPCECEDLKEEKNSDKIRRALGITEEAPLEEGEFMDTAVSGAKKGAAIGGSFGALRGAAIGAVAGTVKGGLVGGITGAIKGAVKSGLKGALDGAVAGGTLAPTLGSEIEAQVEGNKWEQAECTCPNCNSLDVIHKKRTPILMCTNCGQLYDYKDGELINSGNIADESDIRKAQGKGLIRDLFTESLEESVTVDINNGTVTSDAGEATIDMNSNTVSMGAEGESEMIAPLEASDMETIETNVAPGEEDDLLSDEEVPMDDEAPVEDEVPMDDEMNDTELEDEIPVEGEEDVNFDDIAEESFNYMAESFMRRIYENVDKFEAVEINEGMNGDLIVDGLITFTSGNTKKTSFVFTESKKLKNGKVVLEGYNETFSKTNKSFVIKGQIVDNQFIGECLKYNYKTNVLNESNEQEPLTIKGRVQVKL